MNITQKRRFRFFRILLTNSVNDPRCNVDGRQSGHHPTTLLPDKYTIHTLSIISSRDKKISIGFVCFVNKLFQSYPWNSLTPRPNK